MTRGVRKTMLITFAVSTGILIGAMLVFGEDSLDSERFWDHLSSILIILILISILVGLNKLKENYEHQRFVQILERLKADKMKSHENINNEEMSIKYLEPGRLNLLLLSFRRSLYIMLASISIGFMILPHVVFQDLLIFFGIVVIVNSVIKNIANRSGAATSIVADSGAHSSSQTHLLFGNFLNPYLAWYCMIFLVIQTVTVNILYIFPNSEQMIRHFIDGFNLYLNSRSNIQISSILWYNSSPGQQPLMWEATAKIGTFLATTIACIMLLHYLIVSWRMKYIFSYLPKSIPLILKSLIIYPILCIVLWFCQNFLFDASIRLRVESIAYFYDFAASLIFVVLSYCALLPWLLYVLFVISIFDDAIALCFRAVRKIMALSRFRGDGRRIR